MANFIYTDLSIQYCVGASVMIFSFIGKDVNNTNINLLGVKLEYIPVGKSEIETKIYYNNLQNLWHINSAKIFITNITPESNVKFTVFAKSNNKYYQLTNEKTVTTCAVGNIEYKLINQNSIPNSTTKSYINTTLTKIVNYFNAMGCYSSDERLKIIPIRYDEPTITASAYCYLTQILVNSTNYNGVVSLNGNNTYMTINVLLHELRHRYGITNITNTYINRLCHTDDYPSEIAPIDDEFSEIHKAIQFNTGRKDAKLWIAVAHSNALENIYYNDDDTCYLAVNLIRALIYYDNMLNDTNSIITNPSISNTCNDITISVKEITTNPFE